MTVLDQATGDAQEGFVEDRHRSDAELLLAGEFVNDIERLRIATENRLRVLREGQFGENGQMVRPPLPGADAEVRWQVHFDGVRALEHQAKLELARVLRRHPLGLWVKATHGIGEVQGARLLAAIGDPYWNEAEDRPRRGPAELWAYCGYAPGQKRQKGVKSNWNAEAKMRAHLVAVSCMKQMRSPYRAVYDDARACWAGRETSDLHKHNHALRCVAKAILRDLWRAARDTHLGGDQEPGDAHCPPVAPNPLAADQDTGDAHQRIVGGNHLRATSHAATPKGGPSPATIVQPERTAA